VLFRKNELSRKIKWACDLHVTEMKVSARTRPSAVPKMMNRAGSLFVASALYVAMFAMWVALALRLI
jgi:hypothetical protein